ncbi:hypothetical protein SteCoe_13886 [Stentor coeruleus]|uniref:transketolase n=1 Tax=Stentor coeruleus TaxID=5963 RepID=A0A1R2C7A6_9CILI|nr:hypothetical protein SteCoe_13886 [Stentor coeruleus]
MHVIESTNSSNSGHPTSCSSLADIFSILFFHSSGLRYFPSDPKNLNNDKLILSKGHAAPLLYATWSEAGLFPKSELRNLRKIDSDLEGHPTPRLSFVDIATGSLGQGISAGCGIAYSMKYYEKKSTKVFTVLGDAECAEGSVWEAVNFAAFYKLNNLIAIIDVNSFGQNMQTMLGTNLGLYKNRFLAFEWEVATIDGHDYHDIVQALEKVKNLEKPLAILAGTIKGKDFPNIENRENWHGRPLGLHSSSVLEYLQGKIINCPSIDFTNFPDTSDPYISHDYNFDLPFPDIDLTKLSSVRAGFGLGLASIGKHPEILCLDADTKNSTMTFFFQEKYPDQFIECFIAEQNMVGVGLGLCKRSKVPFICTFSAFLTRCFDHIRVAALSFANMKFVGSHSGVSVGEDGATQMGLEDLALFRSIINCLVLYPSDAVSAVYAVQLAANYPNIAYIRSSRPQVPIIYSSDFTFSLTSYILKQSLQDQLCIVAAGVTLHEALKAQIILQNQNLNVRVVDVFCLMPLDTNFYIKNALACNSTILTVEDHYRAGGIYEAVSSELSPYGIKVHGLYVKDIPRSGTCAELLEMFSIDHKAIVNKCLSILS